jgi:hypothetical protein
MVGVLDTKTVQKHECSSCVHGIILLLLFQVTSTASKKMEDASLLVLLDESHGDTVKITTTVLGDTTTTA